MGTKTQYAQVMALASIFFVVTAYAGERISMNPPKTRIPAIIGHHSVNRDLLSVVLTDLQATNIVCCGNKSSQNISTEGMCGKLEIVVDKKRRRPFYESHDIEYFVSKMVFRTDVMRCECVDTRPMLEDFWNRLSQGCRYVSFKEELRDGATTLVSCGKIRGGWRITLFIEPSSGSDYRICFVMDRTVESSHVEVDLELGGE